MYVYLCAETIKTAVPRRRHEWLTCFQTLISPYNKLSSGAYYDTTSSTSFTFDHTTGTASSPQSYTNSSQHSSLITALSKSLSTHFAEHYPPTSSPSGHLVCATPDDDKIAILISSLKASPKNFLSGRWRTSFLYSPNSSTLSGTIRVNVHYYEDGNVALTTSKSFKDVGVSGGAEQTIQQVAALEKQTQEQISKLLVGMNETNFKSLRRQLPVTRQKVEWEKVRGYSLGENLRGEGKR
jgi:hypothetical protein